MSEQGEKAMSKGMEAKGSTSTGGTAIEEPSLNSLAEQALEETGGDWERAAEILRIRLDDDGPLKDAALATAARHLIRQSASKMRGRMRRNPEGAQAGQGETGGNRAGLAAMSRRTWYDWPLPGGKRLGEAVRPDLQAAASYWYTQAEANRRSGAFVERVAGLLEDDGTPVGSALTEAQIEAAAETE